MQIPPNMKRRAHRFEFTELALSDSEMDAMCVIPSRSAPVAAATPARKPRRSFRRAAAAGMAFLALPACTMFPGDEMLDVAVDAVELAGAAVAMNKITFVDAADAEAPAQEEATAAQAPAPRRAVPVLVDRALLVSAGRAMDLGQYRVALTMYRKLIKRQPNHVDALFGAALATHELKEGKASAHYLARTLKLQPDHAFANVLAGFSAQLGKRYDGARNHYAHYLAIEQDAARVEEIRAVLAQLPDASGSAVAGQR